MQGAVRLSVLGVFRHETRDPTALCSFDVVAVLLLVKLLLLLLCLLLLLLSWLVLWSLARMVRRMVFTTHPALAEPLTPVWPIVSCVYMDVCIDFFNVSYTRRACAIGSFAAVALPLLLLLLLLFLAAVLLVW